MDTENASSSGLQFDRAEFGSEPVAPSARQCQDCRSPLADTYYTVDGRVTCFNCSDKAAGDPSAQDLRGLPLGLLFGFGAAALGTLIYLLILKTTGYEIGLIAIAVGWLVGKAMMKGSKGRGGLAYQVLAILLTYHSIVFSYVVVAVWNFLENPSAFAVEAGAAPTADSTGSASQTPVPQPTAIAPSAALPGSDTPAPASANTSAAPIASAADTGTEAGEFTLSSFGIAIVGIYLAVLFSPFSDGFSNIIGIAIIAFGLWEAWRLTRLIEPVISGPFHFGQGPQTIPPPAPEDTAL